MNLILRCEPFNDTFFMFMDSPHQIVRHADIKRAADFAGEDVYVVMALFAHMEGSAVTESPAYAGDDTEQGADDTERGDELIECGAEA